MNTTCIIVDDEPLAIKLIKKHISKFNFIEIISECKNAMQAAEVLKTQKIDLIFLDINMPVISGFDFLNSLAEKPLVIITTAHREFAFESFELDVVDFLLKPISFERFFKAINKYCERQDKIIMDSSKQVLQKNKFIYVQDGKTIHKINLSDIIYFEGFGEYVKIHTENKVYISKTTMHEYETKLQNDFFIRIHKSFIVDFHRIKGITSSTILIEGIELPVGRTYKEQVMNLLDLK